MPFGSVCSHASHPHANNFQLFFLANVPHLLWTLSSVCLFNQQGICQSSNQTDFQNSRCKFPVQKIVYRKAMKKESEEKIVIFQTFSYFRSRFRHLQHLDVAMGDHPLDCVAVALHLAICAIGRGH